MKSEYVIEKKENYLYITVSGEYDKDDFLQYPKLVSEACEKEKIYKVLFNGMNLNGTNAPTMDRYFIGESIALLLGPQIKIAAVWPGNHINKFAETVAVNRGAQILVVGDVESAKDWLLKED